MGYETQLLVGVDTGLSYEDEGTYFKVYATIDMHKMGDCPLHDLPTVNKTPDIKQWYFYPVCGDGDTPITEDKYGTKFQPVPIQDVIAALEQDTDEFSRNRRDWALALLKSMDERSQNEKISVLFYGY